MTATTLTPYRQIRAEITENNDGTPLITVYQAYNATIAMEACKTQRLDASEQFKLTRMTWIKPSWCWMMYRCGYTYKDKNQERVLSLRMRLDDFWDLLRDAELTMHATKAADTNDSDTKKEEGDDSESMQRSIGTARVKSNKVKVQWDPERNARLEKLQYRSIQIGIHTSFATEWVREKIVDITDRTLRARQLEEVWKQHPEAADEDLRTWGLLPEELVIDVPEDVREILKMDIGG